MLIRKIIICCVASSISLLSAYSLNHEGLYHKEAVKLPEITGTEDFGAYAAGGHGGEVLEVTNLNDAGPGRRTDSIR